MIMNINWKSALALIVSACSLCACYEDTDLTEDITSPTGKGYYPVSGNTFTDLMNGNTAITANRVYATSTPIRFELQYWSLDPVKEINLYKTEGANPREKVLTVPYAAAFSKIKSADTLLINYQLPATQNTSVKLDIEIINQNALALVRSLTVKTNP